MDVQRFSSAYLPYLMAVAVLALYVVDDPCFFLGLLHISKPLTHTNDITCDPLAINDGSKKGAFLENIFSKKEHL